MIGINAKAKPNNAFRFLYSKLLPIISKLINKAADDLGSYPNGEFEVKGNSSDFKNSINLPDIDWL